MSDDEMEAARLRAQRQQDPRLRFDAQLDIIRSRYEEDKSDVFRALALADALRQ
eukprot:CAMPEP_0197453924 /NCGR_PEP_ID=MMETSP1175-20131217/36437_1 /TAXON_ID=1003142 /ORGANISM="Triceratium dubium, Strain CCMP147" /LENGTH=53 /DNA_ID=CAMNT_0042987361 /DNA_START=17 /DNA_END=175 /DNA_ORIENTATION=-